MRAGRAVAAVPAAAGAGDDRAGQREERALPLLEKSVPLAPALTGVQQRILESIGAQGATVDELLEATGLSAGVVMAELTMLQIGGAVGRTTANRFVRGKK